MRVLAEGELERVLEAELLPACEPIPVSTEPRLKSDKWRNVGSDWTRGNVDTEYSEVSMFTTPWSSVDKVDETPRWLIA